MDSSTQSLNFPLTATNDNTGRERERENSAHNTEIKSSKLKRLRTERLIHHDSKVTNSRHANASSEITDSSLLATIINHF
jgi:hypothetical protein